ncbi:MAG: glycosyltransferase family 39 protein [Anaerolineae bacterium]
MKRSSIRSRWLGKALWLTCFILLLYFATRITALDLLPLHSDEGLHLTRALEVWKLHPYWEIGDGKIINHWVIALFYPQHDPVFIGRIATIFVAMIGLAAGVTLARRWFGWTAALFAGLLWTTSAYLFFFERLAFSDAEAGALIVLSILFALHLTRTGNRRDVIATGVSLALAALFKVSAAPFAAAVGLILLMNERWPLRRRLIWSGWIAVIVVILFIPPVVYLTLRDRGLFDITYQWINTGGTAADATTGLSGNLARLESQLTDYGSWIGSALMLIGLATLGLLKRRIGGILLAGLLLPLGAFIMFGRDVQARHFVVALPLALTLGGAGLGVLFNRVRTYSRPLKWGLVGLSVASVSSAFAGFALISYQAPERLPLPQTVYMQHIITHASGYGLREAVLSMTQTIRDPEIPVIASMFPDSCRRANLYTLDRVLLRCTDAPGTSEIEAALNTTGSAYVLTESPGLIGLRFPDEAAVFNSTAEEIAAYPRPGETTDTASIQLWLLTRIP